MPTPFPATLLGIKVELLVNVTWTDITQYVYWRNDLKIINFGRANEASSMQSAELTLSLNNKDGRFSIEYTGGAYYPNIVRNIQIRVSINSESSTLVAYSGFRFWGEITILPLTWDSTAADVYCDITAQGYWQRFSQSTVTIGSPFRRYYQLTVGTANLRAYWPMEDGSGSLTFVTYVPGGSNGTFTGTPSFASNSTFPGSDAVMALNSSVITCNVAAGGTPTNNVTRFLLDVPVGGDSASGTSNWNVVEIDSAGTIAKFEVYYDFTGKLDYNLRNSGGTIIASGTSTTNVKGMPLLISCELTPSGANVAWALRLIKPGAGAILESITGTITTASVGAISKVLINRAGVLNSTALGHLAVMYISPPSLVTADNPLNGYIGETALARFVRLCAELGVSQETIGSSSQTLGPQVDATPAQVFQMIEASDGGLLYETKDQFGLGYRSQSSMVAQAVAVTFNYATGTIAQQLTPTFDMSLVHNDVIVTNYDSFSVESILTAGALSIQNPPSGIGTGYQQTIQMSLSSDGQVSTRAIFQLGLGTASDERYPVISIDMARVQVAALFASVPGLNIGDYIQITNPTPAFITAPVKQLVWGYTETINSLKWTFDFNTISELPWETLYSPGTVSTAQVSGASVNQNAAINAGNISGLIGIPSTTLQAIIGVSATGQVVVLSTTAPANPNHGEIWLNPVTGLIQVWDTPTAASWNSILFNAASTIITGTIVASLVAAGTVIAGIVDATVVQASTYIATGTQGEFLAYSGTPASGNMVVSISGFASSDSFSNAYALGIEIHSGGLVLDNQASAPAAVSGASVFYSSAAGRPGYRSQTGDISILERSVINVSQHTVGNTITPTVISATTTYQAGEGVQSSEYEIEIWGGGTWGTSFLNGLVFQMYVDGSAIGNSFTTGIAGQTLAQGFGYRVNFGISVLTAGVSGTVLQWAFASLWRNDPANTDIPSNSLNAGSIFSGSSFDTTASHTLQINANWTATAGGQTFTTYRTRIARRQ